MRTVKSTSMALINGNRGVFIACLMIVYILVRVVSKKAIRPFVENVERQQQLLQMRVMRLKHR